MLCWRARVSVCVEGSCPDSVHHLLFLSPVVYPCFTSPFDCETQTSAPLNDTLSLSLSLSLSKVFHRYDLDSYTIFNHTPSPSPSSSSSSSLSFISSLTSPPQINHESVRCCGCGRHSVCGVADSRRRAVCGGEEQHSRSFAAQDADETRRRYR